jgi:hypothetical protein
MEEVVGADLRVHAELVHVVKDPHQDGGDDKADKPVHDQRMCAGPTLVGCAFEEFAMGEHVQHRSHDRPGQGLSSLGAWIFRRQGTQETQDAQRGSDSCEQNDWNEDNINGRHWHHPGEDDRAGQELKRRATGQPHDHGGNDDHRKQEQHPDARRGLGGCGQEGGPGKMDNAH